MAQLDPPDFHLLPDDSYSGYDAESEPGSGRRLSLRGKLLVGTLAAVLAVSGVSVQLQRAARQSAHRIVSASAPASQSWPTGRDVCGNQVNQPVVEADPPGPRTGIELLIGTNSLLFGNLDSGQTNPQVLLIGETYLFDRAQIGNQTFVELSDCSAGNRIEQVSADGQYRTVLDDPLSNGLLSDGVGGIWAARFTDGGATMSEARLQVILRRLNHPEEIPLKSLMFPLALHGHLLYAEQQADAGKGSRLVVFDLQRRQIVQDLGPFDSAEASDRLLVWIPRRCTGTSACRVRSVDLRTGVGHDVQSQLASGFRVNGAAVSPDRRMLAASAVRSGASTGRSDGGLASDVVVLDLFAGATYTVPHVTVPPGGHIGLAFATDSRRLVLAAAAGLHTDFFVWTPGQARPRATRLTLAGPLPAAAYLRAVDPG